MMDRKEIARAVLGDEPVPLWVPVLTHYRRSDGAVVVDAERTRQHLAQVRPFVRSWMVAGSTGDGWDVDPGQFNALLSVAAEPEVTGDDVRVLVGALRPTTTEVIAFVEHVHEAAQTSGGATLEDNVDRLAALGWVGITICPPVGADVTQDLIVEHYRAVCDAATLPVAVYQLPQVTQNRIEPATMAQLVREHPEIILFKDSSGEDTVARAGEGLDGVVLVRGAEGAYAEALRPLSGPYNGLLLSTGNVFGRQLRAIVTAVAAGADAEAKKQSAELTALVQSLFAAAADAPVGNAFANVNRAVDHVFAYGPAWRDESPPTLFNGAVLPKEIVERIGGLLDQAGLVPVAGYLADASA